MKGGAALAIAASVAPSTIAAPLGVTEADAKTTTWTMQYIVRFAIDPTFEPRHQVGDQVQIRLLPNARDRRSFKAETLEQVEGRVMLVIPGGARPWRYVATHLKAPAKFKASLARSNTWNKTTAGPRYVVGTRQGYALVSAQRMRALKSPVRIREITGLT